jgi:hypothetical protein
LSTASLSILLRIQPIGIPRIETIYAQNYRRSSPIIYKGKQWVWLPFAIENYPTVDLQLSSEDMQIVIGRSAALDNALQRSDDLRRAIVQITHIRIGSDKPPISIYRQVSYSTKAGSNVVFNLRTSTNALQGAVSSKRFEAKDFPELNYYKVR